MAQYSNKYLLGLKEKMSEIYENKTFTNNEVGLLHYRLSEYPEKYSKNENFEEILECYSKYISIIVKYSEINNSQSYTLFRSNISRYMNGVAVIEQIPEFVNKFVKEITVPILEHITDPSINVICAKELIRTYNIIITSCTRSIREELANSSRIYLYKLADLVCSCGDYEYQTCLLETIFRVCPMHLIKAHASDFFPAIESLQQALIKFDVKNFDNSVRIFLRIVNSIVGNVYSFVADDVLLDKVNIIPPADSQGRNIELWIDCNKTSSTLGIYCDQTCLRTESLPKENDGMGWELITIFVDDISLVEIKKPKKTNEAQNSATLFRFTLINQFHVNFPSSEGIVTSKYLKVVIYDSKVAEHLQNSIFPFMFGEKLQGIANKKSKMSDISSLEHSYSSKGKYKPLRISVNSSVKSITSMDSRSMKSLDDLMGVRNAVNKSKNIVTGVKYVSPNSTILDVSFGNECVLETQYFSANEELDSDKNLEQEVTGKSKIYQSCLLSDYDKKPLKKEKIKVKFPFIRKQVSTRKKSFDPLFSPISESIENSQLERKDSVPKPSCSKQIDAEMEENGEVIVSTPPDINQRKTKKGKRRKEKHFQTITQKQPVENEVIVENVQAKTLGDVKKMNQSLNDLENNLNERQQEILLGTEHNSVERCDVLSRTCEIPETTKERRSQDNLNQINPEIAVNGSNNNICKPEILEDAYEYFTALWDELDDVVKGTEQEDPATNNKTNSTSKSCKSVISAKKLIPVVIQEDIQKIGDKNSTQSNGKNFPQKYKQDLKKRATESITSNELANSQIEKIIHKNNDKNDHITDSQILECSEIVADAIETFSAEEANKKGILTSQVMETESSTKDLSEGKLLKKKGTQKLCDEKQLNFEEENAHSEETKKVYHEILNIAKIMAEKNSNLLNECSNKAEIGTETLHSTPSQKIPIIRRQEGYLLFAKRGDSQLTESNDSTFANENLVQTIRRNERKDVGAVQDLKLKVKRTNLEELRNTQEGLVTDNNINSASKNCKSLVTKLIPLDVQQDRDKDLNQDDVAGGNSRKCKRALRKRATVNEPANSQMEKSIEKTNEKDDGLTHSPPEIIAQRIEKANKGHHSQVVDMECSKTKELSEGKLLKKKETQKLYDEKQHVEVEYAESEKISDSNLPNECLNKPQTRMKELNVVPSQKNDSLSIVQQQKSDLQFERKAGNQLIESDGSTFVDENLLQALGGKKQKDVAKPVEMENAIINVNKSTIKSEHVVDLTQLPGNNGNKSAYATEANNFNDKTITKAKYTKDSDSDMSSQVISGINTFQIKQKKKIRSQMRRSQSSNKKNDTPDAAVENYKEGTNLEISEGGDAVTRAQTNASSAIVSNAIADEFIGLQNSMFDEFLANETTHLEIKTVPSQKEHVRVNVSQNIGDVEKNLKIDKSPASAVDQSEECAELRKSQRKKSLFYNPDSHLHDDHKNVKKKRTERKTKNIDSVHQNTRQKTYSYIEIKENCGSKYEGVSKNIEDKVQKTEDVEANEKKRGRKKTADTQKIPSLCENNNNTAKVNSPPLALSVDDSKITKNNENKDKDVGVGEIKDIKSVKKNKSGIIGKHQKDEIKFADTALENTQKEPKSKVKRKSNVNKNYNVLSVAESDNKMEEVIIKGSVYDDEVDVFLKSTLELDKSDGNTSVKLKRGTENGTKDKSEMTSPILNDDKAVKQLMQTENLLPEEIVCNDFKNDEIENIDAAAIDKDQPQENNKDKKSEKIRNTPGQNVLIHTFDVNTETVISSSQKSKRNSFKRKLSQSDTKLFLKSKRFKLYDPNDFSHLENDDFVDKDLTVIPQCKTSPNKPLKALQNTKQETSTTANKKSLREKNKIKEKRKSTTRPAEETSGTGQDTILNLLSRGAVNISTVPCSLPENLIKSEITNNSVKNTSDKAMSILNGEEETVLKEGVDKTNEQNPNSSNANQRFQLNNIARHNFSHKNYEKTLSSSSSSESDDEPPKRIEVVAMIHSAGERTNNNRNIIHETKKVECDPESVDNKKKGSKLKQTSTTSKQRSRKRKPVVQKNWSPETTKLDQSHKEIFDTFLGSFADDIDKYRVPVNKKHTHSRLQKRNRGKKAMKINILEDIVLKSANEELTNESVESDEAAESDNVPEPMDSTLEIVNDASGSESKHLEVLWREILKLLLKVKNVLIKTAPNSIRHTNEYRNLLKHLLAVKKAATKLK